MKNEISPHLTHMINTILTTNTVPDIFKISRILPISKPGKPLTEIDSYRPINNLTCLEKNLETHVLKHLHFFWNIII